MQDLLEQLKSDDPSVRAQAVNLIGQQQSESAFNLLITLLKHGDVSVRKSAVIALSTFDNADVLLKLIEAFSDESPEVRYTSATVINPKWSQLALPLLIDILNNPEEAENKRYTAARSLGEIHHEQSVTALSQALQDTDPLLREIAIESLVNIGSPEVIAPICNMIGDPNEFVRSAAVRALVTLQCMLSVEMINSLLNDESELVRAETIWAIPLANDIHIKETILKALNDESPTVRINMLYSISKMQTEDMHIYVFRMLGDQDVSVRRTAIQVLGEIQNQSAIDSLKTLLSSDVDNNVRFWCAWSLARLGNPIGVTLLIEALNDAEPWKRMRSVEALGYIDKTCATLPFLIKKLGDSHPRVRQYAAQALGRLRCFDAVQPLIDALKDPSSNVRGYAIWALGEIKALQALPTIQQMYEDTGFILDFQGYSTVGELARFIAGHMQIGST